ncbi:MAG: phage portal protein [Rhodocyclaceae bacterium]|nr:phage portal protein [Rhodocyclaceae bacterium]
MLARSKHRAQVRRFEAARIDRLTADWLATTQSINAELRSDLDRLRHRARELVNNNDYARKFRAMVQANVIGPSGIRLQMRVEDRPGQPDRLANAAIEQAWRDWSRQCDVTGRQTLRDLCETLVGGLPSDGEFLVRRVRGPEAGNKYGYALQLIDVDRIDTSYNGRYGSNAVIMGVEVDAYRRPLALHVFAAHPNDGIHSDRKRVRLPMEDVIHGFKIERPEQLRGIPWMAPGMLSLHHLGNFKLAALMAAEHGANHYGFFTTPDGQAPIGGLDSSGQPIVTSQPGTFDTLPAGVSFQPFESRYPDAAFSPFVKTTLQRIASGWGVSYHSLANDLEGVSFSSIRSGTLEERDRWMADQEWFIATFMEPVFRDWLQMALLMGAITMPNGSALPASKYDKFVRHEWQARRWDWVDPKADTEANILKVKAGLMSPQDLAAAMGYDFEDTLVAIKQAQELAAKYGVTLHAYDGLPGATQNAPQDDARKVEDMLHALRSEHERLHHMVRSLSDRPAQPPVVNLHATFPEQRHEHHVHVQQPPAPHVEVRNEITAPEPVVHLEAVMPEVRAASETRT